MEPNPVRKRPNQVELLTHVGKGLPDSQFQLLQAARDPTIHQRSMRRLNGQTRVHLPPLGMAAA